MKSDEQNVALFVVILDVWNKTMESYIAWVPDQNIRVSVHFSSLSHLLTFYPAG